MGQSEKPTSATSTYSLAGDSDADGTHLFGEVQLSPASVVRRFGCGSGGDEYKVSRTWVFRKGPLVFTLYDWKSTSLYDSDMWSPDELWASTEPFDLHVGSKQPATQDDVDQFIAFLMQQTSARAPRDEHTHDREKHDAICNCGKFPDCSVEIPAHTVGPWEITKNGVGEWMIHLEDLSCIAVVGDGPRECDPVTAEANAHLIAAAPELLSLVQLFRNACDDRISILQEEREECGLTEDDEDARDFNDQIGHWTWLQNKCQEVLNQANGKTPPSRS